MGKLDSKKELLNTLRATFGIIVVIILTLTAGLISMYYKLNIDTLFYIGAFFDIILVISLPALARYIVKNIKLIEGL
jgi:hypothetical protein